MKKYILLVILLLLPFIVNAEECNYDDISIENISFIKTTGEAKELDEATVEGKTINLNLNMYEIGDSVEYKFIIKNDSKEDYELDGKDFNSNSNYIDYTISSEDGTNVVKAKSSKTVYLKAEYKNDIPDNMFKSGTFNDNKNMTLSLLAGEIKNPITGGNLPIILLVISLIICFAVFILLRQKKYAKYAALIVGLTIIIPIGIHALCKCEINVKSNILIPKNYNPCTYEGELTPGAEYVNGQYTYKYMREWGYKSTCTCTTWRSIDIDGWGVRLTDWNSTDPVNTKLCTSINGKPIVSMSYMFYNSKATSIDLSSFDTSNVIAMHAMFLGSKATTLDLSSFDTSSVIDMGGIFSASSTTTLDVSGFNTSNVTDMSSMFYQVKATDLDVSGFDTSNVTNMKSMFNSCAASFLDLSHFDTSKVTNMANMFDNSKVATLDLSSFNTSNVTNMEYMFFYADTTSIDLSSFDTSNVTNMTNMFNNTKVSTLDLSSFDMSNVTSMYNMLKDSQATTGYARTQEDADIINSSPDKPSGLTFVVKSG